jgi:ribosome-interacting GTPase 1
MTTNVSPAYRMAEQKYRQASTPEEELEGLQEMLSTLPKHKGTEKLQADLKSRISKTRQEVQQSAGQPRKKPFFHVEKGGAGQVALVGPPNAGKSRLLAALSHAEPEVADYPFTTQLPTPGMMEYLDVQVQLVDLPAVKRDITESWVLGLARSADLVLLLLDAQSDDVLSETEELLGFLAEKGIELVPPSAESSFPARPALMVAAKVDSPHAEENLEILQEFLPDLLETHLGCSLTLLPVSAEGGLNLHTLQQQIFEALHVIRVYTKAPHKPAERTSPYVLPIGATVEDAARAVHKDFLENLKFARIWGEDTFDGQQVGREHELRDGDLIELHV